VNVSRGGLALAVKVNVGELHLAIGKHRRSP
jgi:hypothetical protein